MEIKYIGGRIIFRNAKEAQKLAIEIFNRAIGNENS